LAFNRPDTEMLISTVHARSGTNDQLVERSRTGLTHLCCMSLKASFKDRQTINWNLPGQVLLSVFTHRYTL